MFDEIGVPDALQISSSDQLFGKKYDLLHPTACIKDAVFVWDRKAGKWKNYTGYNPELVSWQTALYYIEHVLAEELKRIPKALIVPSGAAVDSALQLLAARGVVDSSRRLFGFPHASGANGHRVEYFRQRKNELRQKVQDWKHALGLLESSSELS